mgnify:CR=1 FL=1
MGQTTFQWVKLIFQWLKTVSNGSNYFPVGESFGKSLGLIKQGDLHQVELGSGLNPGYIQQNLFLENESDCEVYFMKEESIYTEWGKFIKDLENIAV